MPAPWYLLGRVVAVMCQLVVVGLCRGNAMILAAGQQALANVTLY